MATFILPVRHPEKETNANNERSKKGSQGGGNK